jgi:GNAT superfamily N-acetyltransferase
MIKIQPATEGNLAEIVLLVNDAFRVEANIRAGDRTSTEEIAQLMHTGQFLLGINDQGVIGAVFVGVGGSTGYLGMLAVRPGLQRLGVGRMLIESAEDYCRSFGCKRMTLSTGDVRQELLVRYGKLGYKITNIEPVPPGGAFTRAVKIVSMAKELEVECRSGPSVRSLANLEFGHVCRKSTESERSGFGVEER